MGNDDISRYDRQVRISGWGRLGQNRLKHASLMVAGVGGLGCSSALLLACAGVGRLRIVDRDLVEITNLNRQTLHWEKDVGSSKAYSVRDKLSEMNSDIEIEALEMEIDKDSVGGLLDGVEGIIDGLDNFETRYLLNREAVKRGIPFFHGSVFALEGRATTIVPGRSPCLKCIYESGSKPGIFPVAGPIPTIIGSIQAMEAIKFFIRTGELLLGRMLVFDGEDLTFSEIEVRRNPDCPVCGEPPPNA